MWTNGLIQSESCEDFRSSFKGHMNDITVTQYWPVATNIKILTGQHSVSECIQTLRWGGTNSYIWIVIRIQNRGSGQWYVSGPLDEKISLNAIHSCVRYFRQTDRQSGTIMITTPPCWTVICIRSFYTTHVSGKLDQMENLTKWRLCEIFSQTDR